MKKLILLCVLLVSVMGSAQAQQVAPFKDGERAVFLGNSITDGGHYHSYIWLYYMTRFPFMDVTVCNAGIGGDTAADMFDRLDGDVFDKKPTVLMVTFGMNDTGYFEFGWDNAAEATEKKFQQCYDNFKLIEARLKTLKGVRIVMVGGSPFDETAEQQSNSWKNKNSVMQRISEFQRKAAEENGWEFLDFNAPMTEINLREQAKDPKFTLCGTDRIHPGNDGHMVMAYLYLKAQGFAGKEVADVEVDAAKLQALREKNCKVSNIEGNRRELKFDYLAEALPYPLDTITRGWGAVGTQAGVDKVVPFTEEMNREMLTVKNLKSGTYGLYIDDEHCGDFTAKQLAEGINLAKIDRTPQYQQALAVMHLNEIRWELERKFREIAWVQWGFLQQYGLAESFDRRAVEAIDREKGNNGWVNAQRGNYSTMMYEAVREARTEQMDVLIDKIYEVNKPQVRRVELRQR